jgi:hypothetical protein
MRTVVLSSLFFCMTLCVTLIPVFGDGHAPEKELSVTPATYLLLVIPAIAAANALFVFIIYYAPLRRLFYALEKSLQTLTEARGASATQPASSSMIDGTATRHGGDDGLVELMDSLSLMVQLRDMELVTEAGQRVMQSVCALITDQKELHELAAQQQQQQQQSSQSQPQTAPAARGVSPGVSPVLRSAVPARDMRSFPGARAVEHSPP